MVWIFQCVEAWEHIDVALFCSVQWALVELAEESMQTSDGEKPSLWSKLFVNSVRLSKLPPEKHGK